MSLVLGRGRDRRVQSLGPLRREERKPLPGPKVRPFPRQDAETRQAQAALPGRHGNRVLRGFKDRPGLTGPGGDVGPTDKGDAAPEVDLRTGQRVRVCPMVERPKESHEVCGGAAEIERGARPGAIL